MASADPCHNCQPIKITSTSTVSAMANVSHSNALSPKREGRVIAAAAEIGSPRAIVGAVATAILYQITF
jgi:hypothetical protein